MLLCDTGSTDRTPEVARDLGAKVLETDWRGFSETRRFLFRAAKQPWILWIDADEVVDPTLRRSLQEALPAAPSIHGFQINRQVIYGHRRIRHGDWFPDWNLRLFRSDRWEMESRQVHESVQVPPPTPRLAGLLDHYSFRDRQDLRKRGQRYASLWAETCAARRSTPSVLASPGHAFWRWFRGFILKRGFLDGRAGWTIAVANARETALKYRILRQTIRNR